MNLYAGISLWLLAFGLSLPLSNAAEHIHLLLLTSILILVPLTLRLLVEHSEPNIIYQLYTVGFIVAAALVVASLLSAPGILTGLITIPWLGITGLIALLGLTRLMARGFVPIEETIIDVGLLMLPVGGGWLTLYRLGIQVMDFSTLIVSLTAVHFHILAVGALLIGGMQGRLLRRNQPSALIAYRAAGVGLMLAPVIVAIGITFSLVLEVVGAFLLAGSLLTISVLSLRFNLLKAERVPVRWLLGISSVSLFLTMALAIAYPVGRLSGIWSLTIPQMIYLHGYVNTFGFALTGLLAFTYMAPA